MFKSFPLYDLYIFSHIARKSLIFDHFKWNKILDFRFSDTSIARRCSFCHLFIKSFYRCLWAFYKEIAFMKKSDCLSEKNIN